MLRLKSNCFGGGETGPGVRVLLEGGCKVCKGLSLELSFFGVGGVGVMYSSVVCVLNTYRAVSFL